MTELKRCACGCGKLVKSKRSNAIYATGNCRVKALRQRERETERINAQTDYWRESFKSLGDRYGAVGGSVQAKILNLAREVTPEQSNDIMRAIWNAIMLERNYNA